MQLIFEHTQSIGPGLQPSAIHTPENIVQVLYTDGDGKIYATDAETPLGNWDALDFSDPYLICTDVDVEHMKLKYQASNIFVAWKNDAEEGETVPYQEGVTHSVRHRLAVWALRQDLTNHLVDGDCKKIA